jgi:regulatory protein
MTGCITAITVQKRNRQRCSIFVDDQYAFSLSQRLAAGLHVGTPLSDEKKQELLAEDEKQRAFERSLYFLGYRPRSRTEILNYLEKKGFSQQASDYAMARLEEYGYVDDMAFARMWIESRSRTRPRGEFGLRHELRQKGVAGSVIDKALAGYEETEPAWRAVKPRLKSWAGLDRTGLRQKIHAHLQRRGFCWQTCEHVYEKVISTLF